MGHAQMFADRVFAREQAACHTRANDRYGIKIVIVTLFKESTGLHLKVQHLGQACRRSDDTDFCFPPNA